MNLSVQQNKLPKYYCSTGRLRLAINWPQLKYSSTCNSTVIVINQNTVEMVPVETSAAVPGRNPWKELSRLFDKSGML